MTRNALVIEPDNTYRMIDLDAGDSLATLKQAVGGYIEGVPLRGSPYTFIVNEEGKFTEQPSPIASAIFRQAYPGTEDFIAGAAVLVGPPDRNGDTQGLSDAEVELWTTIVESIGGRRVEEIRP